MTETRSHPAVPGTSGVPADLLRRTMRRHASGTAAWLTARPVLVQAVGDHLLVAGEVVAADVRGTGAPLVHHDGAFGGFTAG